MSEGAAFTIRETPEIRRRIQRDLDRVGARVQEADPHLRSLVLTGGFARGEGTVLQGAPQNDYDLVALRGAGKPRVPYERLREGLEGELGLHIDLAPVPVWRLRFVRRSIFWYETAVRGRVLWGDDLLSRIRVRRPQDLRRDEGFRLLANRSAGLLLVTQEAPTGAADAYRIQAAKGILAAFDVHLLAAGMFPPSQRERWKAFQAMASRPQVMPDGQEDWLAWAYEFKVDPERVARRDSEEAWSVARRTILRALPVALRHMGAADLADCARSDGWPDRVYYALHARHVPGARRLVWNPSARVRVATIRLLARTDGPTTPIRAVPGFPRADGAMKPLAHLAALRRATLQ